MEFVRKEKEEAISRKKVEEEKGQLFERKRISSVPRTIDKAHLCEYSIKSTKLFTIGPEIPQKLKLVDLNTEIRIVREREKVEAAIPDINTVRPPILKLCNITDTFSIPSTPSVPSTVIPAFDVEPLFRIPICTLEDKFQVGEKVESQTKQLCILGTEDAKTVNIVELSDTIEILDKAEREEVGTVSAEKLDYARNLEQKLEQANIDLFKVSKGSGSLLSGGAIIVLSQDRDESRTCLDLLQLICARLRRERGQSEHDPKIVSGPEEMERHSVYDYCIFVLRNADLKDIVEKRIQEFKRNCPSYFIIETKQEKAEGIYSHIFKIKDKFFDNVLLLELVDLSMDAFRSELAPILFGYLVGVSQPRSVDEIFGETAKLYRRKLERIKEEMGSKLDKYPVVRTSVGGVESDEHYLIKHFVVKYLVDNGISKDDIETEVQVGGVVPDVYVKSRNLAIEVETLFGKGSYAVDKLRDEILDYPSNFELWIVMENFTMFLHLKEIFRLRNWLREIGRKIEFYTLDLKNEKLVPVEKFVKDVLKAFRIVV